MIVDKLVNINLYKIFPDKVTDFIFNLSSDIVLGRHEICDGIYANVELYSTKYIDDAKFESHNDYVDVQILLKGQERIYYSDRKGLTVLEEYNKQRDITFYSDKVKYRNYAVLDGSNFVMLFPHEAHAPQVAENSSQEVLKVVVKIRGDLLL